MFQHLSVSSGHGARVPHGPDGVGHGEASGLDLTRRDAAAHQHLVRERHGEPEAWQEGVNLWRTRMRTRTTMQLSCHLLVFALGRSQNRSDAGSAHEALHFVLGTNKLMHANGVCTHLIDSTNPIHAATTSWQLCSSSNHRGVHLLEVADYPVKMLNARIFEVTEIHRVILPIAMPADSPDLMV